MSAGPNDIGLTLAGCRERQARLRRQIESLGVEAALIVDPRHVYYFSGYFVRRIFSPVLLIERDGPTVLSIPLPPDYDVAADETVLYASNHLGTLVDDQLGASVEALSRRLSGQERIGLDIPLKLIAGVDSDATRSTVVDLAPTMLTLRRSKDADEVAFLKRIIEATEAAYAFAVNELSAGRTEVELFAGMQQAAVLHLGEGIGDFGNDFQIGAVGSLPRRRAAREGEAAILDVTVECRGYRSDMCRTLIVGSASSAQREAHAKILEVLADVESAAEPGASCRRLYESAKSLLEGFRGWSFPHHLGHGIGMGQHEAPRLNPHWDDTLQVGDVFTVEPGLYSPELRAGVRVEQVYHLSPQGLEVLTAFPTGLDGR